MALVGEVLADPALGVLRDYFQAVITAWLRDAWLAVAPNEAIVRSTYTHDPEELDFTEHDLPVLCVWLDRDAQPKRLADGYQEAENILNILWVLPPTPHEKGSVRFPFFAGFNKAISFAVLRERDPAYVHPDDAGAVSAVAYGSDVLKHAGLDWWRLRQPISRVPVEIDVRGAGDFTYAGYLASLTVGETNETDPSAYGVHPFGLRADVSWGGEFSVEYSSEFYS